MKDKNITIEEALRMDSASDEFFEVYKAISEKYWDFENPNDFLVAAKCLVMFAERYDEEKVILAVKIIEQIIEMDKNKSNAGTGHLVFGEQDYFFDIYQSEAKKDSFHALLAKAGKKVQENQFGKNFFKDKK